MKLTRKQTRQLAYNLLKEERSLVPDKKIEKKLRAHVGGANIFLGNPIYQAAQRGELDQGIGRAEAGKFTGAQTRNILKKLKLGLEDINRDELSIYLKKYNLLVFNDKLKPKEAEMKAYQFMQAYFAKKDAPKEEEKEEDFLSQPDKKTAPIDNVPVPKKKKRKAISNDDIEELQELLNEAIEEGLDATDYQGKSLEEDGLYGSRTRSSIGKFLQDKDVEEALVDAGLELPGNYKEIASKCQIKKSGPGKTNWIKLSSQIAKLNDIDGNKYQKMSEIIEEALEQLGDSESEDEKPEENETDPVTPPEQSDPESAEKISSEKKAMLAAINISEDIVKFWSGVNNGFREPFADKNIKNPKYHGIKGMLFNDDEALAQKYYEEILFEEDYKPALDELASFGKLGKALAFFFRQDLKFEIAKHINQAVGKDLSWSMPPKDIDKSLIPDGLLSDPEIANSEQKFTIQGAFFDI